MKKRSNKGTIFTITFLALFGVIAIGAIAFYNYFSTSDKFYKTANINGIDVGGMTIDSAANVLQTKFVSEAKDLKITLKYKDKNWQFNASDFEIIDDFTPIVENAFESINSSNLFEKRLKLKELKKNNGKIDISYRKMLGGFDEKINLVCDDIYQELKEPSVVFDPNKDICFTYENGQDEVVVDRQELENLIDNSFKFSKNITVEVPTIITTPVEKVEDLKNKTQTRAKFSTSYANSNADRKNNIKTALAAFNGQIIMPDEEVSFNSITGARTKQNGYRPANIILNGVYVEGSGGGVCQASTTLYNALLLANVEILEVNKHSMPASYVPLAFDAMVSEGISDLKFKNTTGEPLYIKTWCDKASANVEIFGKGYENGEYYKTRSEFVKSLPHPGDRIIKDDGQYSNKVTFKGEYLRIKYPHEGYEANAYLQHFNANDELIEEILVRHEVYAPQEGIIIEGTEDVFDGITVPENNVKFIPPQDVSTTNSENISNVIKGNNNEKYNP